MVDAVRLGSDGSYLDHHVMEPAPRGCFPSCFTSSNPLASTDRRVKRTHSLKACPGVDMHRDACRDGGGLGTQRA